MARAHISRWGNRHPQAPIGRCTWYCLCFLEDCRILTSSWSGVCAQCSPNIVHGGVTGGKRHPWGRR